MKKAEDNIKVKSLYKALILLDYFAGDKTEWGITELSKESGVLKTTVYNILSTYEAYGILEHDLKTNKYKLGYKILELSNQLYRNNDIRLMIRPIMEELEKETGENIYLAKLYQNEVIYLEALFSMGGISGRNIVGIKAPAYCTGIGKAQLAFQPEEVIDDIIAEGLTPYTDTTITNGEELKKELELIRKRGYAVDNMEHEYGVRCVAAPIYDYEGNVIAACSISGPSLRFTKEKEEKYAQLLLDKIRNCRYI